jgi:hypothetical protein
MVFGVQTAVNTYNAKASIMFVIKSAGVLEGACGDEEHQKHVFQISKSLRQRGRGGSHKGFDFSDETKHRTYLPPREQSQTQSPPGSPEAVKIS